MDIFLNSLELGFRRVGLWFGLRC